MKKSISLFTIILSTFLVSFAQAADRPRVSLSLSAEGWVSTQTAKVILAFDSVPDTDRPDKTYRKILDTLSDIDQQAEWQIINYRQRQDQTGLTQWRVLAETRLDGADLLNLPQQTHKQSEPGFRVSVAQIDYRPSQSERTAAEREVRTKIHAAAQQELVSLQEIYPESEWHIVSVDFTGAVITPLHKANAFRAEVAAADMMTTQSGATNVQTPAFPVAERILLDAILTLERRD